MRIAPNRFAQGNVILCVLCVILIVSVIGGNVLLNCVTRYNAASTQVRSWKESLDAAETGGDIAYAEIRKSILDPSNTCVGDPGTCPRNGWAYSGGVYTNSPVTYGNDSLTTSARVDPFYYDSNGNPWYRIRSKGTAPVSGLKRVTMDDRMGVGTRGDSLLRKIDFNYDHFTATYGPNGDNLGKTLIPVSQPQIARRVELIAAPLTPFDAAIKAGGTFYGLGSAAYVDSFRSSSGPYDANVRSHPTDPRYVDAFSGTVEINTAVATIMGNIYGNVYTNGGTLTHNTSSISGIIDNNVPFSLPLCTMPDTSGWSYVPNPTTVTPNTAINPPSAGSGSHPNYYVITSFANNGDLLVNPYVSNGTPQETYVAIHVTSDIGTTTGNGPTITVPAHVHLQIYFDGNLGTKANNITNTTGFAGNVQFYGISPTDPNVQQRIDLNSAGGSNAGFSAVFYAPSANFTINGGPDIIGAIVCKNFYTNGNVHWHYDRALDSVGNAIDYRIVSYVEDSR